MSDTATPLTPLTRDLFVNFNPRTRDVDLPDWGIKATVRELKSSEANEFQKLQTQSPDRAVGYLIRTAVIDGDGQAVFSGPDLDALPAKLTDALVRAIVDLSFQTPATPKS